MPVAVGAGAKLRRSQIALTMHAASAGAGESPIINPEPLSRDDAGTICIVDFDAFDDPREMVEQLMSWSPGTLHCVWGIEGVCDVDVADLRTIASALMSRSAGPGCAPVATWKIDVGRPIVATVRHLAALGHLHVEDKDDVVAVSLTEQGLSYGMETKWQLTEPTAVLSPRLDLAIDDLTDFELIEKLRDDGWAWQKWTPRSSRSRRGVYPPDAYVPGADKVWASQLRPHRHYLEVLLLSEALPVQITPTKLVDACGYAM